MNIINRLMFLLGLLNVVFYTHTMDEGFKIIETIHVPRAITLATNSDCVAVGTAFGPVKLYDHKGKDKGKIPYGGDGGLVFDDNKLMQVSRKGEVFTHIGDSYAVKQLCNINALIYSIAHKKGQLFFGSDNDIVHTWDCDGKYVRSYPCTSMNSTSTGQINAIQVTDESILTAGSHGHVTSINRETGFMVWDYCPGYIPLMSIVTDGSHSYAGYKGGDLLACDEQYYHERIPLKKWLYSLAFLKSGYLLVGHTGSIGIYDMRKTVRPLIELMLDKKDNSVVELATTEKGFVALVDDGTLQLWEEVEQK